MPDQFHQPAVRVIHTDKGQQAGVQRRLQGRRRPTRAETLRSAHARRHFRTARTAPHHLLRRWKIIEASPGSLPFLTKMLRTCLHLFSHPWISGKRQNRKVRGTSAGCAYANHSLRLAPSYPHIAGKVGPMLRPWQVSLGDRIDSSRDVPIYMQIIQVLIRDIERGRLTSGTYLPSSRELSRILGVNRKTVVLAYEDLIAQGWLDSAGTRGTMRRGRSARSGETPPGRRRSDDEQRHHRLSVRRSPRSRPIAVPPGPGLKIDEGAPDGRLFPAELLARAYRVAAHRASQGQRLPISRSPRFAGAARSAIATMLKSQRGLPVTAENICITPRQPERHISRGTGAGPAGRHGRRREADLRTRGRRISRARRQYRSPSGSTKTGSISRRSNMPAAATPCARYS
jgi:DNA-binding transcriptional regulator YhcF (GntR family)